MHEVMFTAKMFDHHRLFPNNYSKTLEILLEWLEEMCSQNSNFRKEKKKWKSSISLSSCGRNLKKKKKIKLNKV